MFNYFYAGIEDLIEEEMVAHATEVLFEKWGKMSRNEWEDLANRMAEKDRSLAERILDFVRDLLEKFKKALEGYKANSLEARTLKGNIDLLEDFEDVFMNALREYGERNKAAGQTGELVDARGQEAQGQQSEDGEVRYTEYIGTPLYAAPEQAGYGLVSSSAKSDVYGVVMLLNVMVTGEVPQKQRAEGKLWTIIEHCIRLDAEKRYTVSELIEALDTL